VTRPVCPRLWQVEAAHDGRLAGNELSNALRHRSECRECADEHRALSELHRQIRAVRLPAPTALRVRRTRQALLGAWNEQLLGQRGPSTRSRLVVWSAVVFAAAALVLLIAYHALRPTMPTAQPADPFFHVVAQPGTQWHAREESNLTRLSLVEGSATFTVRRPIDRRMLLDLPDGEIEDLGTVFEVEVRNQHTVHVAVSQGRIAVRLNALPEFELSAGQSWQSWQPAPAPAPAPDSTAPASAEAAVPPKHLPDSTTSVRPRTERSAAMNLKTDSAEDDAYLHIVDLLRNGHELEARAKAAQYLAQFPNGFRRVEVEQIVRH